MIWIALAACLLATAYGLGLRDAELRGLEGGCP